MRPRGRQRVTSNPFNRADWNGVGSAAENPFDHVCLNDVEGRMSRPIGANIIDFLRRLPGCIDSESHRLPQPKQFIARVIITLRAITGNLEVWDSSPGY